jgi:hypothetical protein
VSQTIIPLEGKPKVVQPQPVIAANLRDHTRKLLVQLLNGLFDCTDDALFELADRSNNDADHHLYFHSMRQIRLQRTEIEQKFLATVMARYDRLFLQKGAAAAQAETPLDMSAIGLLQGDELEVNVAVGGIVSKVTSQFSLPIMELTKRLDAICPTDSVTERTNPLGPQMICEAFVAGIENLEVDIRVRLILLKLFERLVMQNMLQVYEQANELLIKAGVLPELKRRREAERQQSVDRRDAQAQAQAHADAGAGNGARPAAPQSGAPLGDVTPLDGAGGTRSGGTSFGFIQSLLSGAADGPRPPLDPNQPVLATSQLVNVLNAAQIDALQQVGAAQPDEVPALPNLHALIASRVPDVIGAPVGQLRRADDDVVNFIGMLFDYILNDRNLAIPMKALIARLQIPIVKLAIMDKSFFEKNSHPARHLLNELSSVGIGWSSAAELKRDHVYDMVESVIARILNDFNDNPGLFGTLLEELRTFRLREEQRQQLTETRVRQTEAGKARTLSAKQIVQQLINQKASGMRLPPEAGRFISEVWSRVLVYACLKHGTRSTEWQELVQTLDDFLWSLQPLQSATEIERRDAITRSLLGQIGAGIELIHLPATEVRQWLATLEQQLGEIAENDRAYLDQDERPQAAGQYTEMEEIVLATAAELNDPFTGPAPEPSFLAAVQQLKEGVWIELDQEGTDPLRCKLTAIIEPGARYVFVNRRGMKVLEKSRLELARDLQDGHMRILNDTQVFDRALQTVIGNLRQMQARPTA